MPPHRPHDLDAPASRHFTYRALIQCGETFARLAEPRGPDARDTLNLPVAPESWTALSILATTLLEPVVEHFGPLELTYGFAGPTLTRHIPGRIAPSLDQHAAWERTRAGRLVCPRQGAAVDLRVPGVPSRTVARFITTLPFDRLYFYGDERPLHVSVGPEGRRALFELRSLPSGQRVPRKWVP